GRVPGSASGVLPVPGPLASRVSGAPAQAAAAIDQAAANLGQFVDQVDQAATGALASFASSAVPVVQQIASSASVAATAFGSDVGQFLDDVAAGAVTSFDTSVLPVLDQLAGTVNAATGQAAAAQHRRAAARRPVQDTG